MRTHWQEMPMLRIAFALISGIVLEIAADSLLHVPRLTVWAVSLCLFLSLAFLLCTGLLKNIKLLFRLRIYRGIALAVSVISLGYVLAWFNTDKNYPQFFGNFLNGQTGFIVKITEPPVVRPNSLSAPGDVLEVTNENKYTATTGSMAMLFTKDSLSEQITYGDIIALRSNPDIVKEPRNPDEFNYRRYQSYHNINYQCYVAKGDWKIIRRNEGNFLLAAIYRLRNSFLHVLEKYVKDENDFGVASAIMLGYRDYINPDIMRAYASSGVIHVLSVSGLHVSVMFFMLSVLLRGMDNRGKKLEVAKAVIVISFIWFYACLTGLSPPVLRSALMFTLIQTAQVFVRNKNMFNIVTASAVVLLLFNPFFLMDAGFQLSYLAVYGIIYLFPKIYRLFQVKNSWLDKIWALIAVSLAAQVVTVPLSVYYFHQFPNLFLLSNLFVIPLSDIVLYTGTALFAVSHIPVLNDITGWAFNELIVLLDKFIFGIDALPFALIRGLGLTFVEMALVYALIVLLCWLTEQRKATVLIASLAVVLTLSSFHAYKIVRNANRQQLAVYSVPHYRAVTFITGTTAQCFFDDELLQNRNLMQRYINNHWTACGINKVVNSDSAGYGLPFGRLFVFAGQKILIVDSNLTGDELPVKLKADVVIISGNPPIHLFQLKKQVDFKEVVFDSSNSPREVIYWMKEAEQMGVKGWDVSKGAYIKAM